MRILVTGMNGLIGGIVARRLAAVGHELIALDRRPIADYPTRVASIEDGIGIRPAFEGVDVVVHMAGYQGQVPQQLMAVNVTGTLNVFEAASQAGVRRVIYASSGAVQEGYEREEPILSMVEARLQDVSDPAPCLTHLDPVRPVRLYGVTKVFGECLGRSYAERGDLSVLCLRLGRVTEADRPQNSREAAVYLSHEDAAQLVERCVDAPMDMRFDIFYGVSDNFTRFRDIEHARDRLGYQPRDGIKCWPLPEDWAPG